MKKDVAVREATRSIYYAATVTLSVLITGCAGGQGAAVTPQATTSIAAPLRVATQTPQSVSPASVSVQPMPETAVLPASAMLAARRSTQSQFAIAGFTQIPGGARDVAVSPDSSIWVVSSIYGSPLGNTIWHYVNGVWTNIPGLATRLAVGPDNSLWAVNGSGGIYHYANGAWSTLAGGASDISVGPDGSVYVISSLAGGPYGKGIWHYANGVWTQIPGSALRIAASSDANTYPSGIGPNGLYVTNAQGSIFYYNATSGYIQIPGGAVEVAPTTQGGLFALGSAPTSGIYYNDLSTGVWTQQPGAGVSIATNSSLVVVVGSAGGIYTTGALAQVTFPITIP